jgi:hypothetical protein
MKSINLLSLCFVVVLGVASLVDAVDVDNGFKGLRNLGTGEKPATGVKTEKKPKVNGDAKDKVESKGMGKKGSMGDSSPGVTAPQPKGGSMSKGAPKVKVPTEPESDVPSSIVSTVPSLTPS